MKSKINRKEFLQYSGKAIAAGYLSSWMLSSCAAPVGNAENAGRMKKSLKFGMIEEDLSVLDKFKLLKDLGFDGVELDSPNELSEKEILDARDKTGLEIPGVVNSVHWKAPLSDPDPSVRKKCVDSMETALQDCKKYGGTTVLLVPGVVGENVSYDEAYARSQEEIKKILPIAEETGVKIAIENVWNNFLLSPLEAARYIDEFESDMIGWYFDVGNIVRYGWPEQWIRILGKRIIKVDIKEYSRKLANEEGVWEGFKAELLEGDCNWQNVMTALNEVGYAGWGSAEIPGGDRKRLEKISQLMDEIYSYYPSPV
ncbi:sugar phosphate isomerase/epimerase family protein [Chondrinema litorale]|uniref:sugar phosphate isomerase/epimerase family protein n=1 Tax=Chondrinema litorale TaxID=2994555 RepID=UPI002542C333|nr:sugar phosphate isomerase/epimerase family protein [Chondrinema litorale]UZR95604.1 sugar phosphate isomerase/epimerase [Chondrinema litorale]